MAERFLPTRCWFAGRVRRVLRRWSGLLKRVSEVEGTDFPRCAAFAGPERQAEYPLQLTTEAGDRFYKYTAAHTASSATPGSMAIVLDNKVREVAAFSRRFATVARSRRLHAAAGERSVADAEDWRAAGVDLFPRDSDSRADSGVRLDSSGDLLPRLPACWRSWPSCWSTTAGAGINADLALMLNPCSP